MAKPPLSKDITRSLPYSDEAEKGILSCCLQFPENIKYVYGKITQYDKEKGQYFAFHHPANKLLFKVLVKFVFEEKPVDLISLSHYLLGTNQMDKIGGPGTLAELYNFAPTTAHLPYYLSILQDNILLRRGIMICDEHREKLHQFVDDVPLAIKELHNEVFELVELSTQSTEIKSNDIKDLVNMVQDELTDEIAGKKTHWIKTRWHSWNQVLGGISFPSYILILGPRSGGKSSLAQNLITTAALSKVEASLFSYEMSREECVKRAICDAGDVFSGHVFKASTHKPPIDAAKRITLTAQKIKESPLRIYNQPSWNADKVIEELYRTKPKIAAIDYLQLLPKPHNSDNNRSNDIARTSQLFNQARLDLGMCIIVLSQKSSSESRKGEASWSDGPENDCTVCVSIEHDHLYVRKNRNGNRDVKVYCRLNGAKYRFEEYEPEEDMPS